MRCISQRFCCRELKLWFRFMCPTGDMATCGIFPASVILHPSPRAPSGLRIPRDRWPPHFYVKFSDTCAAWFLGHYLPQERFVQACCWYTIKLRGCHWSCAQITFLCIWILAKQSNLYHFLVIFINCDVEPLPQSNRPIARCSWLRGQRDSHFTDSDRQYPHCAVWRL